MYFPLLLFHDFILEFNSVLIQLFGFVVSFSKIEKLYKFSLSCTKIFEFAHTVHAHVPGSFVLTLLSLVLLHKQRCGDRDAMCQAPDRQGTLCD